MNAPLPAPRTDAAPRPAPELAVVVPTFRERDNVPVLVARLAHVLAGVDWEVIFVDDNSPDGTAAVARALGETDARVRCIRRIGRRGLAGACIEGMLASQARYVAVMDADLQHDEGLLVAMLEHLRRGDVDLVAASRYRDGGSAAGLASGRRASVSRASTALAHSLLGVDLSDPLSGYFMLRREIFERLAPDLSSQGFKILLDIVATARGTLRIAEVPLVFRERLHGESKLDIRSALDFAALVVAKLTRDTVSFRFLMYCLVGATGIVIHMATLRLALAALAFGVAQSVATVAAICWNFVLNNMFTYRDQRLAGAAFLTGLVRYLLICLVGAISNVGIASAIYQFDNDWWIAGLGGALMGAVWNYVVSAAFVWRLR
jgi:dolichol-phosphate mannosyltransferase